MGFQILQPWVLLLTICAFSSSTNGAKTGQKKSKSVTTQIEAKWTSTPFLLETAEYLAEESPDIMWKFLESINEVQPDKISKCIKNIESVFLKY
jgi:Thioredoxin-like domain